MYYDEESRYINENFDAWLYDTEQSKTVLSTTSYKGRNVKIVEDGSTIHVQGPSTIIVEHKSNHLVAIINGYELYLINTEDLPVIINRCRRDYKINEAKKRTFKFTEAVDIKCNV